MCLIYMKINNSFSYFIFCFILLLFSFLNIYTERRLYKNFLYKDEEESYTIKIFILYIFSSFRFLLVRFRRLWLNSHCPLHGWPLSLIPTNNRQFEIEFESLKKYRKVTARKMFLLLNVINNIFPFMCNARISQSLNLSVEWGKIITVKW